MQIKLGEAKPRNQPCRPRCYSTAGGAGRTQ